jgi:hypothetical protein
MNQVSEKQRDGDLLDLPPLPAVVVTPDGQAIDITSSIWSGRVSQDGGVYVQINWSSPLEQGSQRGILTSRAWYLVKLYLADRLSNHKLSTVVGSHTAFLAFSRWLAEQDASLWLAQPEKGFDWSDYAEFERELIAERTRAGLIAARARGHAGGRPYTMTSAKIRLAMAAMGKPETNVAALCAELGISRQTLYRHVSPEGTLRPDGERLLAKKR